MNQKTDFSENQDRHSDSEFSPDFIRLLIALTGATLLLVFVFEHDIFRLGPLGPRNYLFPWVYAGGHTIANGLAEFSGKAPALLTLADRLATLLSLLIGFIIGPTLLLFGWYHRRQERASGTQSPRLQGTGVLLVIGGILTFAVVIPSIPVAIIRWNVEKSLKHAQAIQTNKDLMINELNMLKYSAYQYRVLPRALGGGEGSYAGFSVPSQSAKTDEATYTATVGETEITMNAVSLKYPSSTISCAINSSGEFISGNWSYTGEFQ